MISVNQFDWVDFYQELAHKLLPYKSNRKELIAKILKVYETTSLNIPTLEKDNQLIDIDPFTFLGLFNKTSMKEVNRIKIITAIAPLFQIESPIPTSFNSIPVLNNQNATFYLFIGEREDNDIDDLWNLFESALTYAENPSAENRAPLSRYFDATINKKGNGNSKITMGLYWISPNSFLNLDQRNTWYIYESGKIPASVVQTLPSIETKIPASKYFNIVEKLRNYLQSDNSVLKDFKDLSFEAWRYSEEVNQEKKAEKVQPQREAVGDALADADVNTVHYWIYSPGDGAYKWDEFYAHGVMGIGWKGIGDLRQYATKDAMKAAMKEKIDPDKPYKNAAHATWQFANEMKPGDVIFVKKGMHQLVGRGIVASDYYYDSSADREYPNFRNVTWTDKGTWDHPGQAALKTLTDITPYTDYVSRLLAIFDKETDEDDTEEPEVEYPSYDKDKFLAEVFMSSESYNTLVGLIRHKKNVILQGAPGVGKTYAAKRLAYSMMGVKDQNRVMMVQFHQSY